MKKSGMVEKPSHTFSASVAFLASVCQGDVRELQSISPQREEGKNIGEP